LTVPFRFSMPPIEIVECEAAGKCYNSTLKMQTYRNLFAPVVIVWYLLGPEERQVFGG